MTTAIVPIIFKDPLWLFLLFGGLLFGVTALQEDDRVIVVSEGDIVRLEEQWRQQMQRDPKPAERQGLLDRFIRDEAYYQEALALNLDAGDTIVKRRLVQKLTFLTEDLVGAETPSESELRTFYADNLDNYKTPEQFSFTHIYFSADRRADAPEEQARTLAARAVEDPTLAGDPFMLQRRYVRRSTSEVGDLFGRAFMMQLAELSAQEAWQGPLRSAFGWHAVQLTARQAATTLSFEQVQEKVALDWKQQKRRAANEAYRQNLLASYEIQLPPGEASTDEQ